MGQVNDAVPFDVVGFKKVEKYLEGIVGVFEHAGRDFVGEPVAAPLPVDVKVQDAHSGIVGISVRGRCKIQAREDHGVGGVAQLAFEFQHDVLLRDVERKSFARDSRGAQGDGDGLLDCGREVEVGLGCFDFAGGEVTIGFELAEGIEGKKEKRPSERLLLTEGRRGSRWL